MPLSRQKKIALMGTSSAGKTTLLSVARTKFPQAVFVDEAARDYFKENKVVDRFCAQVQGEIQLLALSREKIAHQQNKPVIFCDRSVLDAVVYTREHGDLRGAEKLFRRVSHWLPTYTHFVLLDPTDIPYEVDEVRTESKDKRNRFHQIFLEFFDEKKIPYILLKGNIDERLEKLKILVTSIPN